MSSSLEPKRIFNFGSYKCEYVVVRQKRKTLGLSIGPDLNICIKCPQATSEERIEAFLKRKWLWLKKQQAFFSKYQKKVYQKEYVSGESFYYLGRQYQLVVKSSKKDRVRLDRGKIFIETTKEVRNSKSNERLLSQWYQSRTEDVFLGRLEVVSKGFRLTTSPELGIREMSKRWGSYLKQKRIILNPRLIMAPKECIDYVITHELCHFKYKNHDDAFYRLLDSKFPGWKKTKEKLECLLG
jgi:predicted metal-dependent hydrolase